MFLSGRRRRRRRRPMQRWQHIAGQIYRSRRAQSGRGCLNRYEVHGAVHKRMRVARKAVGEFNLNPCAIRQTLFEPSSDCCKRCLCTCISPMQRSKPTFIAPGMSSTLCLLRPSSRYTLYLHTIHFRSVIQGIRVMLAIAEGIANCLEGECTHQRVRLSPLYRSI